MLGKTFTRRRSPLSGRAEADLDPLLASLVRKEVLTLQADPRSPERGQYGFLHALFRKVAYDTLSRKERKARHLAVAVYLERVGPREAGIVEVVASHYLEAYRASPDADDAASIKAKACARLARAAERAASLAASEEAPPLFAEAAELEDDPSRRGELLERAGASRAAGDTENGADRTAPRARRSSCSRPGKASSRIQPPVCPPAARTGATVRQRRSRPWPRPWTGWSGRTGCSPEDEHGTRTSGSSPHALARAGLLLRGEPSQALEERRGRESDVAGEACGWPELALAENAQHEGIRDSLTRRSAADARRTPWMRIRLELAVEYDKCRRPPRARTSTWRSDGRAVRPLPGGAARSTSTDGAGAGSAARRPSQRMARCSAPASLPAVRRSANGTRRSRRSSRSFPEEAVHIDALTHQPADRRARAPAPPRPESPRRRRRPLSSTGRDGVSADAPESGRVTARRDARRCACVARTARTTRCASETDAAGVSADVATGTASQADQAGAGGRDRGRPRIG